MQVDNLLLERSLGEGTIGKIFYTTIKGETKPFATKVYDRINFEQSRDLFNYLKTEVIILKSLDHPNIIKLKEVKKTKRHFYLAMEYCNGGELKSFLIKYQEKNKCAFSEEIVQYLMRQIMGAMCYLHSKNITHQNIKLENILLQFDSEEDKKNLDIMKSQVKIIDFGFATNSSSAKSIIEYPFSIDPLILNKLTNRGRIKKFGYDAKTEVWSLGSMCYEMLIGRSVFDAEDMTELIEDIKKGNYVVPSHLSKEVISFLNGMLQYDSSSRLSIWQLISHKFLIGNIKYFHKIDLEQVTDTVKKDEIEINNKKEKKQTIWSIYKEEEVLNKIIPSQINPNHQRNDIEILERQNSLEPKNKTNKSEKNIKSFHTYDNSCYPKLDNLNYFNENNSLNYGPILPFRDESPIYINKKFKFGTGCILTGCGIYNNEFY